MSQDDISPHVNIWEAYRRAADVREEINTEFDDLVHGFQTVDFYVTTFPQDENIIQVAESVVLAVLKAAEKAISFSISYQADQGP